jgi:hypothetical protein
MAAAAGGSYTYGVDYLKTAGLTGYPPIYTATASNNSEVISILMDIEKYPLNGTPTVNAGHVKNPQRAQLLSIRMVSDTASPGVGADLVYRDPWGNPYIITLDLNYDEKARDVLYSQPGVSSTSLNGPGLNGLMATSLPSGVVYEAVTGIMVWSFGPDKKMNVSLANLPPNKDNALSWK